MSSRLRSIKLCMVHLYSAIRAWMANVFTQKARFLTAGQLVKHLTKEKRMGLEEYKRSKEFRQPGTPLIPSHVDAIWAT